MIFFRKTLLLNSIYFVLFLLFVPRVNAEVKESIVKLRINDTDIATGFFIDKSGTILTAYHTICGYGGQKTEKIEIYQEGRYLGKPSVIGYDSVKDIALLKLNIKSNPLQIVEAEEEVEALLAKRTGVAYGFPDGKPLYRVGINFNKERMIKAEDYIFPGNEKYFSLDAWDVPLIPFNATISAGMSGGPIMVDGKVIGIVSGTQAIQGNTFGWGIPTHLVKRLERRRPIAGKDLRGLGALRLVQSEKAAQFIKGMRYVDIGELSGLEVIVIGASHWWERIERHEDIKFYFDRGIKFRQISVSQPYERFIIRQHYLKMKKHPKFDHRIDFEEYHYKRNSSYTRKDMRIFKKYNLEHTPTFIAYYKDNEISRYARVNNVLQYLFWKDKKQNHIKPNSFGFEYEPNKKGFISFLNGAVDTAKKERYSGN